MWKNYILKNRLSYRMGGDQFYMAFSSSRGAMRRGGPLMLEEIMQIMRTPSAYLPIKKDLNNGTWTSLQPHQLALVTALKLCCMHEKLRA